MAQFSENDRVRLTPTHRIPPGEAPELWTAGTVVRVHGDGTSPFPFYVLWDGFGGEYPMARDEIELVSDDN